MDFDEMRGAMERATAGDVVIHSDPDGRYVLWQADCRTVLSRMRDNSVDAIVTDPPYFLGFMGKSWDSPDNVASTPELWREALRVLKPGGHLLAFGGSRTYHRLACAVEDAGFEIRDQIMWVYGSGFPKSLDVGKAIDKMAGAEREVVGTKRGGTQCNNRDDNGSCMGHPTANGSLSGGVMRHSAGTAPATDAAKQWDGWGTALKPAHEPIVVARKPLEGTVAANVLKWGTGALNIDGCRVDGGERPLIHNAGKADPRGEGFGGKYGSSHGGSTTTGRWPANFIHDGSDEVLALFPESKAGTARMWHPGGTTFGGTPMGDEVVGAWYGDSGSAARFFYCAKAGKKERNAGVPEGTPGHPTVKPIALMRYLVRLVTPPGGVVLDPFAGSGTTMVAALLEGAQPWGCEMTAEYVPIILGRVQWALDEVDSRIKGTT